LIIAASTIGACVSLVAWGMSYLAPLRYRQQVHDEGIVRWFGVAEGILFFLHERPIAPSQPGFSRTHSLLGLLEVYSGRTNNESGTEVFLQAIEINLLIPLALLSAYPTIAVICGPLRRHRRRKHGLCVKCSYNLTGNVSGACPECGTKT